MLTFLLTAPISRTDSPAGKLKHTGNWRSNRLYFRAI